MKWTLLALSLAFTGCNWIPKAKVGNASVTGVKDQGTAATVNVDKEEQGFDVPAGSTLTVTKVDPGLELPATVVEQWTFAGPTRFTGMVEKTSASTGTVDQTVAKARIAEESRKWLIWAGIGFIGIGALLAFNPYMRYPLGGVGLGGTGALLLFAHQNPTLFYIAVGVGALAVGIMFGGELMERISKKTDEPSK
jgi:hypothetical protein